MLRLGRDSHRTLWLIGVPLAACLALTLAGCPLPPGGGGGGGTGNSGLTGKYIGSTACKTCHSTAHTEWSETLHATALETLEEIGQGSNAACVGCHTVGFGEAGGFANRATTNDLAGVGCEACHGAGQDHQRWATVSSGVHVRFKGVACLGCHAADASIPLDLSTQNIMSRNLSSSVCGRCHQGEHHPTFEDWEESRHSQLQETLLEEFADGTNAASCGACHSGDYFYWAKIQNVTSFVDMKAGTTVTVGNAMLKDKTEEQMAKIECAICHDPHAKTGKAIQPEDGRDYQLRFDQIKFATPTNDLTAAQDPTRFNICGQCHHARNRVWTDSSREPHPSDQVNVFFGEMPLPPSDPTPIVASRPSVHLGAPEQCSTCHVYRRPIQEGIAPAVSGHTFEVNFAGCVAAGCHQSEAIAQTKFNGLKVEMDGRAAAVKTALDAWAVAHPVEGKGALSWEYTSEGGPSSSGQAKIPNAIKKARYIYYYVVAGGGNGVHNPDYVREGLINALALVNTNPDLLP